ncbi:MAG: phosphorylase [Cyanobacteria bacterium P01_F01_bin.86]
MNSPFHSLRQQVIDTTEQALESGALQPIATQLEILPDASLQFYVRILDNLVRKEAAQKRPKSKKPFNPFLPYEKALFVAHLSETHACLLNKYNVVEHHILMVTREYESQESWLTQTDFEALTHCLAQINGLGFYNGGSQAGASQHHKHLQLVPFSETDGGHDLPLTKLILAEQEVLKTSTQISSLPFRHSIQLLKINWAQDVASEISQQLFKHYQDLMIDIGLKLDSAQPDIPYNLLVTREWMAVVPRSQESYQNIGVNSLGYSGWLLVKNYEDLEKLKQIGPMNLLKIVGKEFQ